MRESYLADICESWQLSLLICQCLGPHLVSVHPDLLFKHQTPLLCNFTTLIFTVNIILKYQWRVLLILLLTFHFFFLFFSCNVLSLPLCSSLSGVSSPSWSEVHSLFQELVFINSVQVVGHRVLYSFILFLIGSKFNSFLICLHF